MGKEQEMMWERVMEWKGKGQETVIKRQLERDGMKNWQEKGNVESRRI